MVAHRIAAALFIVGMLLTAACADPVSDGVLASSLNERGIQLYSSGQHDQAIALFSAAIELAPKDPALFHNRGMAEAKKGDWRAFDDFTAAISMRPDEPMYYNARGQLLMVLGRPHEALRDFNKALSLRPGYAEYIEGSKSATAALGNKPVFDPDRIAELLDRRDHRAPAAAAVMPELSQSEIKAFHDRIYGLWSPPVDTKEAAAVKINIRIKLKRDGTLVEAPTVETEGSGPVFAAMRDSAVRAVLSGQPYTMLRADHYEAWKDISLGFDGSDMFGNPARRQ